MNPLCGLCCKIEGITLTLFRPCGLFDYSVYSWPGFNQMRILTRVGPGKDLNLDLELDNNI